MKEQNKGFRKVIFWLELVFIIMIPFVLGWYFTPTNILNSHSIYKVLEAIGFVGGILLPVGIPAGILGIAMADKMVQLRKPTVILSIINIVAGGFEIVMTMVMLCALVIGGLSV